MRGPDVFQMALGGIVFPEVADILAVAVGRDRRIKGKGPIHLADLKGIAVRSRAIEAGAEIVQGLGRFCQRQIDNLHIPGWEGFMRVWWNAVRLDLGGISQL